MKIFDELKYKKALAAKKIFCAKAALFAAALFLAFSELNAQPRFSTQGHKSRVVALFLDSVSKQEAFYSVGQDGFIIRWENGIGERFQASDKKIELAARSPNGKEIAFYERDGSGYESVKVWDAGTKKVKRSFLFKAPVTSLCYSAKGTYLIATTAEQNGVWLYTASNGKPFAKIKDFGMTASWARTSESEKNILLYSAQEGSLAYFSFKTGKAIKKVSAEGGLENPILFAKNKFLAGVKDGAIVVLSAESGAKVKTLPAKSPVFFEGTNANGQADGGDENEGASAGPELSLCYIDGANGLYSLYKVSVTESGFKGPLIAKNIKSESAPKFTAAFFAGSELCLGAQDGNIYSAKTADNNLPAALDLISNEVYQKIHGVCSDGQSLFILTDAAVIKADYDSKSVTAWQNERGWTKIDFAFGRLLLRTDDRHSGISQMDFKTGKAALLLDTPNRVKKIKAAEINGKQGFLAVENSKVSFYCFEDGSLSELYLGSGIQDAAAIDGNTLAVAKTASSNPPSALVLASLKTRETVPVKMDGDIAVRLEESGGFIFGSRLISAGGGYSTSVFCMGTKAMALKELAASPKEESDAFVRAEFPLVFTKVGSKDISVINAKSLKKHSLKSGSSFAVDIAKVGGRLASLNEDSSITWYNVEQPLPLAEWYIDGKNQIVEF